MRFSQQAALVTGGARGIGAATATRLAREGAAVGIVDLDPLGAAALAGRLQHDVLVRRAGGTAESVTADMTDSDAVGEAFAAFAARHGRLDVLVNNAGATRDDLLHRMSREDWEFVLTTNLSSAFHGIQAAQSIMVPARRGSIVNLSSRSSLGNRGQANYAAAKAGVTALTATAAIELGAFGIRVNAVAPGYIATNMTAAAAQRVGMTPDEHKASAAGVTPLGRVGQPEEVAAAICFLASSEASYISGQTLFVNGGAR